MSRLPAVTGKQPIDALMRLGFAEIRVRGSHHYLRHPDGRSTVAPSRSGEVIGRGLLSKILPDTETSRDERGGAAHQGRSDCSVLYPYILNPSRSASALSSLPIEAIFPAFLRAATR